MVSCNIKYMYKVANWTNTHIKKKKYGAFKAALFILLCSAC